MKINDHSRDERSSKHDGGRPAVPPKGTPADIDPVSASRAGGAGKPDPRERARKGRETAASRPRRGETDGGSSAERQPNPGAKR